MLEDEFFHVFTKNMQPRKLNSLEDKLKARGTHTPTHAKQLAVHGCHCPGDAAVRMHEVLARPWIGVPLCFKFVLIHCTMFHSKR